MATRMQLRCRAIQRNSSKKISAIRRRALVAAAFLMVFPVSGQIQEAYKGCLFATSVGSGHRKVVICPDVDQKYLTDDGDVREVMSVLGIGATEVRFNGCPDAPFKAMEMGPSASRGARFLIVYPTNLPSGDSYLAPVTHELAHVFQIKVAGSMSALTALKIERIELGADYITGIVYSRKFKHFELSQFQTSLTLIGAYQEDAAAAHGTPAQRTSAFRLGAFDFDQKGSDIRNASNFFQAKLYAQIKRY